MVPTDNIPLCLWACLKLIEVNQLTKNNLKFWFSEILDAKSKTTSNEVLKPKDFGIHITAKYNNIATYRLISDTLHLNSVPSVCTAYRIVSSQKPAALYLRISSKA